jgi:arylsulfatase A
MGKGFSRREFLRWSGRSAAAAALSGLIRCSEDTGKTPPNIVLFFADDMGYGDLGCYGHPTIRTPNLDRLALEGIRLTSFYAASPGCSPSRAALLTGRYPLRCGVPTVYGPETEEGLPESEITLADILKKQGYRTMAVGKWHLGHARQELMPTSRGFDHYFGLIYSNDMKRPWVQTDRPLSLYRDLDPVEQPVDQSTLTPRYTSEAIRFIKSARGAPFFLYVPLAMPHLPISASDKFRGTSRAGLYGDVIEEMDWSVGRILGTLKEEGMERNTIVIFTSDNGPWSNMPLRMLQEGVEKWHAGTTGHLRGTKWTSYEGGYRVPGIIRWPGKIPAGQVSADPASTMDLFTTLTRASGAEIPSERVIDGLDILPFLEGRSESPSQLFFYERGQLCEAVRQGRWKYRLSNNARPEMAPGSPPEPELFDLDVDPGENHNLAERFPDVVSRLDRLLRDHAREVGGKTGG